MTAFIIMAIIGLSAMQAYLMWGVRKYGTPHSISETYYLLHQEKRGWLFQLLMVGLCFIMVAPFIEATPPNIQFLAFLPCASLAFIGLAPRFAESYEAKIHYIATGVAALTSLLWFVFAYPYTWAIPVAALLVAGMAVWAEPRKWMFWVELTLFDGIFVGVILALIV